MERILLVAGMSRLKGGIIFDDYRKPIAQKELNGHLIRVKEDRGLRCYYHLDEDSCVLTRYELFKGVYIKKSTQLLRLNDFSKMQLAYEVATGFDIKNARGRVPFTSGLEFS